MNVSCLGKTNIKYFKYIEGKIWKDCMTTKDDVNIEEDKSIADYIFSNEKNEKGDK